jgi:two-component system alkaline phosphatase synthesis response regulator PhoP
MKTIWIVEDDEEMSRALQLMLRMLKFDSQFFLGVRPALKALMEGKTPDLFLLDIIMPEISGLDFLEFIRRRPEFKQTPVIMLSTEAAEVTIDRALALGADDYVTKPVAIDELEKALRKAFLAHGIN